MFLLVFVCGAFCGCWANRTVDGTYPLHQSVYVSMSDGTKIAVDVWLPKNLTRGTAVPAIVEFTRYWRSYGYTIPMPDYSPVFNDYGYAFVGVDVRGTGASYGTWEAPWSPDEVHDYYEIIDWIVGRTWSDGNVGAIGQSYTGAAAQMAATTGHPALKAIVPMFTFFDIYLDVGFPGGAFNAGYVSFWASMNRFLDANNFDGFSDFLVESQLAEAADIYQAKQIISGVRPVDEDWDRSMLGAAVDEHKNNIDLYDAYLQVTYRDDTPDNRGISVEDISVYTYRQALEDGGAAIYSWDGWHDGGGAHAALARFATLSNPQKVVIGPWGHGTQHHTSPYLPADTETNITFEETMADIMDFFDMYLEESKDSPELTQLITYYTMGSEQWNTAETWPPAGAVTQTLYFGTDGTLAAQPPRDDETDIYAVDFTATTGENSRYWLGRDVICTDRSEEDKKLLTYTTEPLQEDMEITGYPVVTLYMASTEQDGSVYAYLEDVYDNGTALCVTEGQLRVIHRKVSDEQPPYEVFGPYHSFKEKDAEPLVPGEVAELGFCLYPTSAVIRKGHRIRVAVAGHDDSVFFRIPENETPVLTIHRSSAYPSNIVLPLMKRSYMQ